MLRLDWSDIEVAAEPENSAYSPNALLGHMVMLLRPETKGLPFTDTHRAAHYSALANRSIQAAHRVWEKHRRKPRDPEVDVVKSLEQVLDEVRKLFVLGLESDPFDVMSEERFFRAADVVCKANGHGLPGTFLGRFSSIPTEEEAEIAEATLRQDEVRFREFESTEPCEWLMKANTARVKRQLWVHAAEKWASLRSAADTAFEPEPLRLENR